MFKVKSENIQFMTVIESPCDVCTVWHTGESNTLGDDSNLKSEMNLSYNFKWVDVMMWRTKAKGREIQLNFLTTYNLLTNT